MCLAMIHSSIILTSLNPYILKQPAIKCQQKERLVPCFEEDVCTSHQKYVFDNHDTRSIVYEWKLICDYKFYQEIAPFLLALGLLIGFFQFGKSGERNGRRISMIVALVCSCSAEFVLFCSASPWFFDIVILLLGIGLGGCLVLPWVWICEVVCPKRRYMFLGFLALAWAAGEGIACGISYSFFTWRPLVLSSLASGLLSMAILARYMKESPRYWAVNLCRYIKARAIFQKISESNRAIMFEDQLQGESLSQYGETSGVAGGNSERSIERGSMDASSMDNSQFAVPFEYLGANNSPDEREHELQQERGQHCDYVHLCKLSSVRWKNFRLSVVSLLLGLFIGSSSIYEVVSEYKESYLRCSGLLFGLCIYSLLSRFTYIRWSTVLIAGIDMVLVNVMYLHQAIVGIAQGLGYMAIGCVIIQVLETMPTPLRCIGVSWYGAVMTVGFVIGSWVIPTFIEVLPGYATAIILLHALPLILLNKTHNRLQDFIEELISIGSPIDVGPQIEPPPRTSHVKNSSSFRKLDEEDS